MRETFLKYFWTNCVRNELNWGSPFHRNMEFSYAVPVMDKTGGWEEGKEDESQTGARSGACIWTCTKAASSLRSEGPKLHSITEAISKTWDFLLNRHAARFIAGKCPPRFESIGRHSHGGANV